MNSRMLTMTSKGAQLSAALLGMGLRVRVRVSGTSMAPALVAGDVVELHPVKTQQLACGDILYIQDLYYGYYLHRLLRRTSRNGQALLQTRGDHQWRLDCPVAPGQVLGRVGKVEYNSGRWRRYFAWLGHHGAKALAGIYYVYSGWRYLLRCVSGTARLAQPAASCDSIRSPTGARFLAGSGCGRDGRPGSNFRSKRKL